MYLRWLLSLLTTAALGATATASAQMPLRDALSLADQAAFPNRVAAGNTAAQRGQALAPLRGVLPSLRFDAGYTRTTDPISTFGMTLQQRSITTADFDPQHLPPRRQRRHEREHM